MEIAGAAIVVGTAVVGYEIQAPDLDLPAAIPARQRPTGNTTKQFTAAGLGTVTFIHFHP